MTTYTDPAEDAIQELLHFNDSLADGSARLEDVIPAMRQKHDEAVCLSNHTPDLDIRARQRFALMQLEEVIVNGEHHLKWKAACRRHEGDVSDFSTRHEAGEGLGGCGLLSVVLTAFGTGCLVTSLVYYFSKLP